MELIVERPAALDVHKAQVTACVRVPDGRGRRDEHVAEFSTTPAVAPDENTGALSLRSFTDRTTALVVDVLPCVARTVKL